MTDERELQRSLWTRRQAMETERRVFEDRWQEVTDKFLPRRGFYVRRGDQVNQVTEREKQIMDGLPARALRRLAAGMHSGLTPPSQEWFRLKIGKTGILGDIEIDTDISELKPVKTWLKSVERIIYEQLAKSNFYSTAQVVYLEQAAFGTACALCEEDVKTVFRFRVMTAGEYMLSSDAGGRVDTVYRDIWMTARQMVQRFGEDRVSRPVSMAYKDAPDRWFQVLHVVQPRAGAAVNLAGGGRRGLVPSRRMPFESIYLEAANDKKVLSEGGYEEFPYVVPRWEVMASDDYGGAPTFDALPDVRALFRMQEVAVDGADMSVRPPVVAPKGLNGQVQAYAGGITYVTESQKETLRRLYENVDFNIQQLEVKIAQTQQAIKETFYNDLFMMPDDKLNMTATEALIRQQEKLLMLGPVIERNMNEFLDPVIERCFGILLRAGMIPRPPEELMGRPMKVEYVSSLAAAQKRGGVQNLQAFAAFVLQLAQLVPDALDKFDADQAIDEYGDKIGVVPEVIRGDDQVAEIRAQRAQQQAAMEQVQQAGLAIEGAKGLGQAKTEPGTALGDIVNGMEGQA